MGKNILCVVYIQSAVDDGAYSPSICKATNEKIILHSNNLLG